MDGDFENLNAEEFKISNLSRTNLSNLSKLNEFFKAIYDNGINQLKENTKIITSISAEVQDAKTNFSNIKAQNQIYSVYLLSAQKAEAILMGLHETIIQPIQLFNQNLRTVYTENLDEFHNMKTTIIETKKKLELAKLKYFDSTKYFMTLSKQTNVDQQALEEAKNLRDNQLQLYRYEICQTNNLYNMYNKKHNAFTAKMKATEESRIAFLKDIMTKYSNYLVNYERVQNELNKKINDLINAINLEEDSEKFKKEYHFTLYGSRFQSEEFENYVDEDNPKATPIDSDKVEIISQSNVSDELNLANNFLSRFILGLFGEKEVEVSSISQIIDLLYNSISFSKEFIDYFISTKKSSFYVFKNITNLQNLANIFKVISETFEKAGSVYDINFAIIFLAEKTYCTINDGASKVYLCALLSQEKLYTSKSFWIGLMEFKLARKLEEHLKHLLKIDIIKPEKPEQKSGLKGLFGLTNAIKGVISKEAREQNKANRSLLEKTGLSKNIKNYKTLPDYKKPFLDQFAGNEVHLIIKEFIIHICNFGFKVEDTIDIIIEVSTRYQVPKERLNYYVANIGAWNFSVKRFLPKKQKNADIEDKIKNIKEKRFDLVLVKFPIQPSIDKIKNEQKTIILVSAAKYLPVGEIVNIFSLYKHIYTKGRIKIFKEILNRENTTVETRIKIWKCLLDITEIKKKYVYEDLQKEINSSPDKIPHSTLDIINIDVKRTAFKENEEESKAALVSILKAIAYIRPTLNYCQGMNYISSFLYQLLGKEPDTFYLMLGLVEKTNFSQIFIEDLQKLKSFFVTFERLLNLYFPEIYYTLRAANINVNCFAAPWFLTLFTNTCIIIDPKNPPKVVLKIWDEFFLKKWKALMTTGLALLKHTEPQFTGLRPDEMLHYFISVVIKSEFFKDEFYEKYLKLIKETKIPNKLIADLEREYELELKENNAK